MTSRGTSPTVVQDTIDRARLVACRRRSTALWECLHRLRALALPQWYLGAGCVAQSVWNDAHRKSPTADVADFDVVYYDADLSEERERAAAAAVLHALRDLAIDV